MKTIKNTHLDLKLHEINNKKLEETHSTDLGLKIPEDYFSKSKIEILNRIKQEQEPKVIPFYKKKQNWMVAASLLFLLGLSFYTINNGLISQKNEPILSKQPLVIENKSIKEIEPVAVNITDSVMEKIKKENKIVETIKIENKIVAKSKPQIIDEEITLDQIKNNLLVESLFIEDNQLNDYVTNYMLEDI